VAQQANFKTIGRVAVGGGIVAAGACALFAAAPAQASPWGHHNNTTNTTNTASPNVTSATTPTVVVPSYRNFFGQAGQTGFGTPVTGCKATAGCYVQNSTGIGPQVGSTITVNGKTATVPSTPTTSIPVVSTTTGTSILLPTFFP
jgi:hypothetical protein